MNYEGAVYRPPSEAYSLIIQATIGCAHNKCTFCSMYKDKNFRIRNIHEIYQDLELARAYYPRVERIFLADGDALTLNMDMLIGILSRIKELFPECKRIGAYGTPGDILNKSGQDLLQLSALNLGIIYLGIESGSDKILKNINKGVTSSQIIEAGQKVVASGIKLSPTLISGLGGKDNWMEHAIESARVINKIKPQYLGLLTLMLEKGTAMHTAVSMGKFKLLTPDETAVETRLFLENLEVENCVFRSNHASNYLSLSGTLSQDKEMLIHKIDAALCGEMGFKNEYMRGL